MKRVLILTIWMVVFITGCIQSNKAENHLTNNINVYKSVWENVFNQMDIDVLNNSNLHQDAKFLNMKGEVEADGFEAFKNYYNGYIVGFPDAEFTIIDIFGQGDKLVKHWKFKGTHAEIGKKVNVYGATLVKMKDGKIFREQDFWDEMIFYKQLGLPIE